MLGLGSYPTGGYPNQLLLQVPLHPFPIQNAPRCLLVRGLKTNLQLPAFSSCNSVSAATSGLNPLPACHQCSPQQSHKSHLSPCFCGGCTQTTLPAKPAGLCSIPTSHMCLLTGTSWPSQACRPTLLSGTLNCCSPNSMWPCEYHCIPQALKYCLQGLSFMSAQGSLRGATAY